MIRNPIWRLVGVSLLIVLAAGAVAGSMMWLGNDSVKELGKDVARFSFQLLFVAVAGGVIVKEYERVRARKSATHEFRRRVLASLIGAYSETKKIRRVLRARCEPLPETPGDAAADGVPAAVYDDYMDRINAVQIQVEVLVRELKVFRDTFENPGELTRHLAGMERYLGKLIDEYEDQRPRFGQTRCRALATLPRLEAFVARRPAGDFRSGFAAHFHAALSAIQQERLKVG